MYTCMLWSTVKKKVGVIKKILIPYSEYEYESKFSKLMSTATLLHGGLHCRELFHTAVFKLAIYILDEKTTGFPCVVFVSILVSILGYPVARVLQLIWLSFFAPVPVIPISLYIFLRI